MAGQPPLDYYSGPRPKRRRPYLGAAVALIVIPAVIYVLFELQRAPYRPPQDMSTLLGGGEIETVRVVMGLLALLWCACAVGLAMLIRRERQSGPPS